ncbi:integrase catalytic domain-containing protein [Trichonephila clavipes]|nr:integrase catalytic domain-containing protein [Trichonephila clavipes]
MWFSGPDLQTDEYEDNQLFPDPSYRDELKCAVTLSMTECFSNFYDELFNVTNNFIKLIRIFSFNFRFINNIKSKESCNKEKYLTADEVKRSTEFLAKIAQLSEFKAEIDALKKGKGVSKTQMNILDIPSKCVKWKGHTDKSRILGDSLLAANVYALDECVRYEVESSGHHVFVLVLLPNEQWKDECYVVC